MKKIISIIFSILFVLSFCACNQEAELEYGKKYEYKNITFHRESFITIEEIKSHIIKIENYDEPINTISDFENIVLNNLDEEFRWLQYNQQESHLVSFLIPFEAITIYKNSVTVVIEGQEDSQPLSMKNNRIDLSEWSFISYENGAVFYSIILLDGYEIHYNYV